MENTETQDLGGASSSGPNIEETAVEGKTDDRSSKDLQEFNRIRDMPPLLREGVDTVENDDRRLFIDGIMKNPPIIEPSVNENYIPSETAEGYVNMQTKLLSKDAKTYELEKFKKNLLIIFNQENIDGYDELRLGTDQDVKVLKETFSKFGFEVVDHKDKTKDQIIEKLDIFKNTDFTEYGCVGIVVLTHGSFNGALRAKDLVYNETDIIKYFRVYDKPTLITKPKLLIIQACRGTKFLAGVRVHSTNRMRNLDDEMEPYTLPGLSDVLVVHSSYKGEPSTRHLIEGSWFIQALCTKINELSSTHDLESIMTEMKHEVATNRNWEYHNVTIDEWDVYKQMPTVTSTLTRKLYLREFGDRAPPTTFLDVSNPVTLVEPVTYIPATPMLFQTGPCSCFKYHFNYIKKCLKYYLEANSSDSDARRLLAISETYKDDNLFNPAKQTTSEAICGLLVDRAKGSDYFKYFYLHKHGDRR